MRWAASLGVGLLTALVAGFLSGWVAGLCADWYHMSSFEGASGYFIVSMALLGLLAGLILGIVTSRLVGRGGGSGVLKALGVSQAIVIALALAVGGIARLLADVPPRLNGEELLLAVEILWPPGQSPLDAAPGEWSLQLGSAINHTRRASASGPLWREDARIEDGRWIMPGAVEVFTSRGDRILDVLPESVTGIGWVVPLPGYPGEEFLRWSDWLPHSPAGEPPLPDGFRYRFRVVPVSQAIRSQTWGPFEIDTIARGFSEVRYENQDSAWGADARFRLRFRGQAVVIEGLDGAGNALGHDQVDAVAAVNGPQPALLVQPAADFGEGWCYLLWAENGPLRTRQVAMSGSGLRAEPLTADADLFERARNHREPDGRFDLDSYSTPGLYLFRGAVLDTRNFSVRDFSTEDQYQLIERIPPLLVSPDGNSFVRVEFGEIESEDYALAVTRLDTADRYRLAIDRLRTRLTDLEQLDPEWVAHYYEWQPGEDGADRLLARTEFEPLPYRGRLSRQGSYREYRIAGALPELRQAVVAFLIQEFGAVLQPGSEQGFSRSVQIGEDIVSIGFDGHDGHVGVWMSGVEDSSLVAEIAQRFDQALETGQYDELFVH